MNAEQIAIAHFCLNGSYDGRVTFPQGLKILDSAGFEGYSVDFRRHTWTYYLHDGDSITLDLPDYPAQVAESFEPSAIEALIRWAQRNEPDYSYKAFCERVRNAGCAGYMVSMSGLRVVYFGRTAETHTELLPQAITHANH